MIFVIWQGEFEISKQVCTTKQRDIDAKALINDRLTEVTDTNLFKKYNTKVGELCSSKLIQNNITSNKRYKISIQGMGHMLGEEDVITERGYSTTAKCLSESAVVFCMKSGEFLRQFKGNSDCWKKILKVALDKEKGIFQRV